MQPCVDFSTLFQRLSIPHPLAVTRKVQELFPSRSVIWPILWNNASEAANPPFHYAFRRVSLQKLPGISWR